MIKSFLGISDFFGHSYRTEFNKAISLRDKDQKEEAFQILNKLLEIRPFEPELRLELALLAKELDKPPVNMSTLKCKSNLS